MTGPVFHGEHISGRNLAVKLLALGGLALAMGGCAPSRLETEYGTQRGYLENASVNGIDVFYGMFASAGHEVDSRGIVISSAMESVQTIVWFPDDYAAPEWDVCDWFDRWLSDRPNRTLIYVGRDFDAEPMYWRKMAAVVPVEQRADYEARAMSAGIFSRLLAGHERQPMDCEWFSIESGKSGAVSELGGPWSKHVAPAKVELELGDRLVPDSKAEAELTVGDYPFVARLRQKHWEKSQMILVANGSFLLNVPLVNHEHRKLAGLLIDSVKPGQVVFLHSGAGGLPIDPEHADNSFWKVFGVWPLNVVLVHAAVLGLIFCFARWPIFGRPRVPPDEITSDFGKHVGALGEMLRRTKDRDYALSKLADGEHVAAPIP